MNYKDNDGWTALMWAADEDQVDVVRLLLDGGQCAHKGMNYNTTICTLY